MGEVFRLAAKATDEPQLGLYASRYMLPAHIHALGSAMLATNSLMDMCQRIERFGSFLASTLEKKLLEAGTSRREQSNSTRYDLGRRRVIMLGRGRIKAGFFVRGRQGGTLFQAAYGSIVSSSRSRSSLVHSNS